MLTFQASCYIINTNDARTLMFLITRDYKLEKYGIIQSPGNFVEKNPEYESENAALEYLSNTYGEPYKVDIIQYIYLLKKG